MILPPSGLTDWFAIGQVQNAYTGWTGAVTVSDPTNNKLTITGNRASGAHHHGFHYMPDDCDNNGIAHTVFFGNVAHSISGYGAIAANVEGVPQCTEVKDFAAYKVTQAAIMLGGWSKLN